MINQETLSRIAAAVPLADAMARNIALHFDGRMSWDRTRSEKDAISASNEEVNSLLAPLGIVMEPPYWNGNRDARGGTFLRFFFFEKERTSRYDGNQMLRPHRMDSYSEKLERPKELADWKGIDAAYERMARDIAVRLYLCDLSELPKPEVSGRS